MTEQAQLILIVYIVLATGKHVVGEWLSWLNYRYVSDNERIEAAARTLLMSHESLAKAVAYARDKFWFSRIVGNFGFLVTILFISLGGLGIVEQWAGMLVRTLTGEQNTIVIGLCFFAILGGLGLIAQLPAEMYYTFILEQRHGFNQQTLRGFFADEAKSLVVTTVLGGILLSAVMVAIGYFRESWWLWVWGLVVFFSLLMAWIFPTLLAPLFNKFKPLDDAALQDDITRLAEQVGFKSKGVFVMDASKRSTHANAYFTGVFGAKRIVLFDTLLKNLERAEVVAVLGHELGHFALKHVVQRIFAGALLTGVALYIASLFTYDTHIYAAFRLDGFSVYGAVVLFSIWSGLFSFLTQPIMTRWSRVHEFAADRFARQVLGGRGDDLIAALKKLRETSHGLPVVHPWYSAFYYSHPPLLERINALRS